MQTNLVAITDLLLTVVMVAATVSALPLTTLVGQQVVRRTLGGAGREALVGFGRSR